MALGISLAEIGTATNPDRISLKVEKFEISRDRRPSVVSLPGGGIFTIDLGIHSGRYVLTGIVDNEVDQLFIDGIVGTILVGDTVSTTAGVAALWNSNARPARGSAPTATVTGIAADNSYVMISGLSSEEFFIDNEPVTFTGSGATALINRPLPTKQRLEQALRYWYTEGASTLYFTAPSGTETDTTVRIKSLSMSQDSGREDRYQFRMELIVAQAGVP